MKKLADMKLLRDTSQIISMSELRQHPGEILQQVQMGKTFYITKSGKKVAVLKSYEPNAFELAAAVRKLGLAGP